MVHSLPEIFSRRLRALVLGFELKQNYLIYEQRERKAIKPSQARMPILINRFYST